MTLRELLKVCQDPQINLDSEVSILCKGVLANLDFFAEIDSVTAYHFDEGEATEHWCVLLTPIRKLGY